PKLLHGKSSISAPRSGSRPTRRRNSPTLFCLGSAGGYCCLTAGDDDFRKALLNVASVKGENDPTRLGPWPCPRPTRVNDGFKIIGNADTHTKTVKWSLTCS